MIRQAAAATIAVAGAEAVAMEEATHLTTTRGFSKLKVWMPSTARMSCSQHVVVTDETSRQALPSCIVRMA